MSLRLGRSIFSQLSTVPDFWKHDFNITLQKIQSEKIFPWVPVEVFKPVCLQPLWSEHTCRGALRTSRSAWVPHMLHLDQNAHTQTQFLISVNWANEKSQFMALNSGYTFLLIFKKYWDLIPSLPDQNPNAVLLDFCAILSLSITNTMLKHKAVHKWMWQQDTLDQRLTSDSKLVHQIYGCIFWTLPVKRVAGLSSPGGESVLGCPNR